jgi:phosphinothricin acetyltransferase
MEWTIENMQAEDWPQVAAIYSSGIATGIATFERSVPTWNDWNEDHCTECRLVARTDGTILGWIALSPVSGRRVYNGMAEVSLYVAGANRRQGIGTALLTELIRRSEEAGYWSLQAVIIRENTPSKDLFERCGFREIGTREKPARMPDGSWHDVILMERRSRTVGVTETP